MFAEDTPDQAAEVGADVFAQGPVDGDVAADGAYQFPGEVATGLVAQHLDGAVVGFEGVVEGDFVVGKPELIATSTGLPQVAGKLDQFLDHLGGFDSAVVVAP